MGLSRSYSATITISKEDSSHAYCTVVSDALKSCEFHVTIEFVLVLFSATVIAFYPHGGVKHLDFQ